LILKPIDGGHEAWWSAHHGWTLITNT